MNDKSHIFDNISFDSVSSTPLEKNPSTNINQQTSSPQKDMIYTNTAISQLRKMIIEQRQIIESLTSQSNSYCSEKDSLHTKTQTMNTQMEDLLKQVEEQKSNCSQLQSELDEKNSYIDELEQENNDLKQENNELKQENQQTNKEFVNRLLPPTSQSGGNTKNDIILSLLKQLTQ